MAVNRATRRNPQLAPFGGVEADPNKKQAVRYKGDWIKPPRQGDDEISGLNTVFGMLTFSTPREAKRYVSSLAPTEAATVMRELQREQR